MPAPKTTEFGRIIVIPVPNAHSVYSYSPGLIPRIKLGRQLQLKEFFRGQRTEEGAKRWVYRTQKVIYSAGQRATDRKLHLRISITDEAFCCFVAFFIVPATSIVCYAFTFGVFWTLN